jgi:hypothetical protein
LKRQNYDKNKNKIEKTKLSKHHETQGCQNRIRQGCSVFSPLAFLYFHIATT